LYIVGASMEQLEDVKVDGEEEQQTDDGTE
jgi:hypothetical protein